MPRQRNLETLTDLLCIVVSPILVMIMVGSLAFFAIQCFYDGQFFERLNFATGLFVMAAVLVARIAVEEGREYASAFSLPLGLVTVLSVIQYCGLNPLLAAAMVLAIWWSTDKLTWDCTVLDEQKDASGEGLLQTTGLHSPDDENGGEATPDLNATTDSEKTDTTSLWHRWLNRRRRHHTPGVWVVYFGLAAIPLFGLGQALLPVSSRGAGFLLLCIYVACALSLLMITSFLQMRRYLIQRRLEFSDKMAATWLGTGGVLIVGLMILCLLLPRPNTGYSLVQTLSDQITSRRGDDDKDDDKKASRHAVGNEGVKDDDVEGRGDNEDGDAESDSENGRQSKEDAQKGKREGKKGKGGENKSDSASGKSDSKDGKDQQDGDRENGKSQDGDSKDKGDSQQNDEQSDDGDKQDGEEQDRASQDRSERSQSKRDKSEQDSEDESQDRDRTADQKPTASQPPSNPLQNLVPNLQLPPLPKILYFILIGIAVLIGLYFYGRQLAEAVSAFFRDLAEFFRRLFGGKKRERVVEVEEVLPVVVAPKPFRAFKDPFASGLAQQMSPQQLVAYSFEALQAWAYEQQYGREDDQTPLEFAGQIATNNNAVGPHARTLAILYNQAAYAPGTLGSKAIDHMRGLWQTLRSS